MDFILTTFLTKNIDPQRKINWDKNDFSIIERFYNSIIKNNLYCIILHDDCTKEFIEKYETETIKFIRVKHSGLNVIDIRWSLYERFFNVFKDGRCFCVDISDVVVLKNPFNFIENGKVYCGDETVKNKENRWMTSRFLLMKGDNIENTYKDYLDNNILNAGILGGSICDLKVIVSKMSKILLETNISKTTVDMCAFNHVLYTYYEDVLIHGAPVNTEFRKEDINNQICWFKHK